MSRRSQGGNVIDEVDNVAGQPQPEATLPPDGAESHADRAPHAAHEHAAPEHVAHQQARSEDAHESAREPAAEVAPVVEHQPKSEPVGASAPNGRLSSDESAAEEEIRKEWYILKVQSNREESIKEGLMRRVRAAGLDRYFGECIVPTEMVSEFKGGKKRVTKRKLYPGYLVVHMAINDDTWYLVRETTGIGDFTGSVGRPTPMLAHDVQKILSKTEEKTDEAPKLKISFKKGDRVKINEGTFENFEGDVDAIDEANGRVIVMINIFGRSTPVELEYWQIEAL
ncbi:MAG TPA: transcription termination/antitermination protein NusG [Pirellulales bacterium]|nr:transcription termination/antitermination protein NusG [Pirellulales bacterium]